MLVEHRDISEVLKICYNNVEMTRRYHHHQCEEKQKRPFARINPFPVPIRCLSCLNKNGSDVAVEVEKGMVEIRYGEGKRKKGYYRLHGTFEGEMDDKKVSGIMMGHPASPEIIDRPDINDPRKITKTMKILEKMQEKGIGVRDMQYLRRNFI